MSYLKIQGRSNDCFVDHPTSLNILLEEKIEEEKNQ